MFNLAYCSRTNFIEYLFSRLKQKMRFKSYKNQKDLCEKIMKELFELKEEDIKQCFAYSMKVSREILLEKIREGEGI